MYSAIAIGLLVGVTVFSVGVFGAIAYAVASSQGKGQGFEIRTPVPRFFTRIFHRYICPEVVTLNTKLTVIRGTQRELVQNHLNIALINVFQYLNGSYRNIFIP